MDNMETMIVKGLDDELEKEANEPTAKEEKVVKMRRPWVSWDVAGTEYKLKLTAGAITKLEQRFNKSLLTAVLDEGVPPVSTVVTVLQAALQKYHHGIKSYTVEDLFDSYLDEGGTQISLLKDVVYPLMADAGFFTEGQIRMLTTEIEEADTEL